MALTLSLCLSLFPGQHTGGHIKLGQVILELEACNNFLFHSENKSTLLSPMSFMSSLLAPCSGNPAFLAS